MSYRPLALGIGEAVAKRTILRTKENGEVENWGEVAERVARGNSLLVQDDKTDEEYELLKKHIANASLLMSGRHLQHGDETQPGRNQEVFTNCSTASASFLLFYLLMNGSGVGRAYDDDLCLADWSKLPFVHVVLSTNHQDFEWNNHESVETAKKKYKKAQWFHVEDTREGWAKAVEFIETMAFEELDFNSHVIIDFSLVRPKGSPIKGMQNRPASGPGPLMKAIQNIATLKGSEMPVWEQTLWADHYLAECVLVGGARRSARIATKVWSDPGILDFINVKHGGFLWSANNSVAVDEEFWQQDTAEKKFILEAILKASYYDMTGEPGFINQHKLTQKDIGMEVYDEGVYAESEKYKVTSAKVYLSNLAECAKKKIYTQITNPCGEISLHVLGGYCVIADVVPYFTQTDEEAEEAFRVATRALMRVNLMDCLYKKEVIRTNRIGVGMTGVHEYAWRRFGYSFKDLINETKSQDFWLMLSRFKRAVDEEAVTYAQCLGVNVPHTNTTIKPAGTTSKLFGLSEGVHLPAMKEYVRWVQFRSDDPLVEQYKKKGYPTKELKTYRDATIIGFPTQPEICKLGMEERLVTAGEATPEEQYQWLMLLEKYWIQGMGESKRNGVSMNAPLFVPLKSNTGNQVSYTLKYKPDLVSYDQFKEATLKYQSQVRCCSVMPQVDMTAYEYQPEEPITPEDYIALVNHIHYNGLKEDIGREHVDCDNGACPVDFKETL